jgi:tRNA pseudouridine55 synthase
MNAPRIARREVNGWLVLDKPAGLTSTAAVAILKRLFRAKKVGHAGTLDPLASGILPIAFGEATKTVSYVMDGRKVYRFKVRWGIETDTDDAEGKVERGAHVRLIRDNVVVHEGKLSTLKRFKDEVREVAAGQECGMSFEKYEDMRVGDVIECYRVEAIQRSL